MATNRQQQKVEKLHQMIKDGDTKGVTNFLHSLGNEAQDVCKTELARVGTSLHLAARLGHVEISKEILKTGVDINQKQIEGHVVSGKAAIHEAVKSGYFGAVEFLLSRGANVNIQESDGLTPLHIACQFDNTDIVKALIRNGADLNALDGKKQSPLQVSILRGPDETTRYLLKNGADVHITDKDGQSPLHYASEWGNKDIVATLLSMCANVNLQDNEGRTALHYATEDDIYELIAEHGADTAVRDIYGKPARESQLDMEKKEYQDINKALSRHTDIMKKRSPQLERVEAQSRRVFSPGPPIPEVELKNAKTNMLKELMQKRGSHASEYDQKNARANMLKELMQKRGATEDDDNETITDQLTSINIK